MCRYRQPYAAGISSRNGHSRGRAATRDSCPFAMGRKKKEKKKIATTGNYNLIPGSDSINKFHVAAIRRGIKLAPVDGIARGD